MFVVNSENGNVTAVTSCSTRPLSPSGGAWSYLKSWSFYLMIYPRVTEILEMPPESTAFSSIHEISFLFTDAQTCYRGAAGGTLLYTLNTSHITIGKDSCSYKMQDFSRMFDVKPINALLNSTGLDAVTYFNKCEWHQINNYVKNGLMYKLSEVVTLYWPKLSCVLTAIYWLEWN